MPPVHDYVVDNSTGANVRSDINSVLQAILTNNSSSSAPSTTAAYMWWADTSAAIMKIRNSSNNGWINLFTLAGGIDVDAASNFAAAVTFTDDVTFDGATAGRDIVFDRSQNALEFADSAELRFGTGDDMKIYHDGTNSLQFFDSMVGGVRFRTNVTSSARSNIILGTGVALYYDNDKKLETISGGVDISGDLVIDGAAGGTLTIGGSAAHTSKLVIADNTGSSNGNLLVEGGDGGDFFTINSAGNVKFEDNKKALFGAGADLEIYHDASNSRIVDNGTGKLMVDSNGAGVDIRKNASENMGKFITDGAVELYEDNTLRLATFTQGVDVHVSGNAGLRIRGNNADVDPRLVFRRKQNDGNNSEPAAIQMTYVAGSTHESGHLDFFTNGDSGSAGLTKKFRIQNDGVVYLDATFDSTATNARKSYFSNTGQQFHGRNAHETYIVFQDVSNNQIGGIVRGSGSSVAYNTSSDYRLKENVVDLTDAITRLKTLSPKRFNFKSEPSITMDGFLAHEVTAVPEAIEGEKDGVITQAMLDAGTLEGTVGDPIYQGIDQSKLVPLLVAAVKELIGKVETLEAA